MSRPDAGSLSSPDQEDRSRDLFLVWFLVLAAALLLASPTTALWDQDEGAYAGFGLGMGQTGDWVIPSLLWSDKHRKTPLHFWLIATSIQAFGATELAVRLPSMLAAALAPLTIPLLGRPVFGRATARWAAIVMFASLLLPNLGKVAVTDGLLTLFETVAALCIVRTIELGPSAWLSALLWTAVALGTLTKGPPILLLVLGLGGLLAIAHPQRRRLVHLHPWLGLPLALVPLWLWGRLAWERDHGQLVRWLFDFYVVQRVSAPVLGQTGPPGYFLAFFALFFLPWAPRLPRAFAPFWEPLGPRERRVVLGAIAIALACWPLVLWLRSHDRPSWPCGLASIGSGAVAILVIARKPREQPLGSLVAWYLAGAGGYEFPASKLPTYSLGAYAAVAILIARTIGPTETRPRRIALGTLGALLVAWLVLVPLVEPWRGATKRVAAAIEATTPPGTHVVFVEKLYLPSVVFYLERNGRPCRWASDYDFAKLIAAYKAPEPLVLVFEPSSEELFAKLLGEAPPTESLEGWQLDGPRRVHYRLVRNPAAR